MSILNICVFASTTEIGHCWYISKKNDFEN